ncbi:MAG TPA: secondary thiamine-phosphate synthase enzyme YjbQ [Methylomirabilota bacterium]|nr:secondary thiamine-phosphate synthase enzyme YjbQ [Methylomirabilota bacterium]
MKVIRETVTIPTEERTEFLDITKQIREAISKHEIQDGLLVLNSLHTTSAVFVNEFQAAIIEDLKGLLQRLVKERDGYRHDDPRVSDCERGNAHSHLRSMLLGRSVVVGISGGELSLGRFQSIILCELDGPRDRSLDIQLMGT